MYKLSQYLPQPSLLNIYYSLFLPYLTYGITVWDGAPAKYLKIIQFYPNKVIYILAQPEIQTFVMTMISFRPDELRAL